MYWDELLDFHNANIKKKTTYIHKKEMDSCLAKYDKMENCQLFIFQTIRTFSIV